MITQPRFARRRSKKPYVLAGVAVLVAAIMLSGAFAWSDFTQSKVNKFNGTFDADVTLHDEFDGQNKNVFVENSGTNTIYVRVRLDEFMKVGDLQFDPSANVKDTATWTTHVYNGPSIEDCGSAAAGKFHSYYTWNMSGIDRDYTPGTPGMVYTKLGPDGKVLNADTSYDPADPNSVNHHTAAATKPMLMSEYLRLAAQAYGDMSAGDQAAWDNQVKLGCWILDDTDTAANGGGWAYWSQPLLPGTATNLLLQSVTLKQDPSDDWIYRIDVKLQAVSLSDTVKWDNAASAVGYKTTAAAQELIGAFIQWAGATSTPAP